VPHVRRLLLALRPLRTSLPAPHPLPHRDCRPSQPPACPCFVPTGHRAGCGVLRGAPPYSHPWQLQLPPACPPPARLRCMPRLTPAAEHLTATLPTTFNHGSSSPAAPCHPLRGLRHMNLHRRSRPAPPEPLLIELAFSPAGRGRTPPPRPHPTKLYLTPPDPPAPGAGRSSPLLRRDCDVHIATRPFAAPRGAAPPCLGASPAALEPPARVPAAARRRAPKM
jgi:hypothetical protein